MKRTTVYIPDDIHQALKVFAAKNNFSMTQVVISALKTITFFAEKGEEAKRNMTPKQKEKIKQQAKMMTEDLNKRFVKKQEEM